MIKKNEGEEFEVQGINGVMASRSDFDVVSL